MILFPGQPDLNFDDSLVEQAGSTQIHCVHRFSDQKEVPGQLGLFLSNRLFIKTIFPGTVH